MRLSCSSGGSALRWRDTILVNWLENSLALIRWLFFDIVYPIFTKLCLEHFRLSQIHNITLLIANAKANTPVSVKT